MKNFRFKFSFVNELSNYDFESVAHSVVERVKGEEIEDPLLLTVLKDTQDRVGRLKDNRAKSIAHENTLLTDKKSAECRDQLISLRLSIDALKRASDPETKDDALILSSWIKRERRFFHRLGKARQIAVVNRLISGIESNPMVPQALEATGLTNRIEKAKNLCDEIVALSKSRARDKIEAKDERDIIRTECYDSLISLTSALAIKANVEDQDRKMYYGICKMVDEVFRLAHANHKARITKGANSGDSSENGSDEGIEDASYSNENEPDVIETTDSNVEPDESGMGNE